MQIGFLRLLYCESSKIGICVYSVFGLQADEMVRLARNYLVAWFAMLAIACQIFFGMAHVTAMLAVAAGPQALQQNADSLSFSLLQICSVNGLIAFQDNPYSNGAEGEDGQIAKDRCPVCLSAAIGPLMISDAGLDFAPSDP